MRAALVVLCLSAWSCSSIGGADAGSSFDPGQRCFVVDWRGQEQDVPAAVHYDLVAPGTTQNFETPACDCGGFAAGSATCTANRNSRRWDGACTSCAVRDWCRQPDGTPTLGGGACKCAQTMGVGYCDHRRPDGDEQRCACPELCVASRVCDRTCAQGTPSVVCVVDGGALANDGCECLTLLDGGVFDAGVR